ncbi:PREDICTED: neural Wiskott-Aldrich syndrome protein-like [Myotis brandtii]|uniref:neural Wiskott-Aldrich syndrome protein-like n=1 Tax=Myotis brandtii TaxID=109478 RepID=UPI0007044A22|nr:PREDICTED: neural Wiskott-Aldrich syndrome protein-like [Myotis brandtii]
MLGSGSEQRVREQREPPIPGSIVGRQPRPLASPFQAEASAAKAPLHLDPPLPMPTRAVSVPAFPRDGSQLSPRPNQDVTTSSHCPSRSLRLATPNALSHPRRVRGGTPPPPPHARSPHPLPLLRLGSCGGIGSLAPAPPRPPPLTAFCLNLHYPSLAESTAL